MAEPLPRVLTPLQAFGIVVGGTIGASIFLVPAAIAQHVPFVSGALAVWIVGAFIGLAGALTLSELSAMLPQAGGGYVYIRAALGPLWGFLYAWTDAVFIRTAAAATVSFTFGIYFAQVAPPQFQIPLPVWQAVPAICLVAILTFVNVRGAKLAANVQVTGMLVKAVALALALLLPLFLWRGANGLVSAPFWPPLETTALTGFLAALIPVMWTYGGWEQLAHLAEEVRDPTRNLPRVFAAGLITLGVLYLAVSVGIHYVLPYRTVAASEAVGADLFRVILGPIGATVFVVLVMFSTVITTNGALLSGSRSLFALARDGGAPRWLAQVHARFSTPAHAIVAVGGWAAAQLALSVILMVVHIPSRLPGFLQHAWLAVQQRPLFDVLLSYVVFGYLLLQALVAASLITLRIRHPEWTRPFVVPWYPFVPLASICASLFLMLNMLRAGGLEVIAGLCLILLGLPFHFLYSRRTALRAP